MRRRRGFSLVELLLSILLVLLFLGALVFNFVDLGRGADHAEGVRRVEALLRFARAESARLGRVVRVEFPATPDSADAGDAPPVRVLREVDPLGRPGEFEVLDAAAWARRGLAGLVSIERVSTLGDDDGDREADGDGPRVNGPEFIEERAARVARDDDGDGDVRARPESTRSITFRPDGSCESRKIIVMTRDDDGEVLRSGLRLHGITGAIEPFEVKPEVDRVSDFEEALFR